MSGGSYGPIEVFRTGTFSPAEGQTTTITEGELRQIAADYDPVDNPTPVVIGHPQIDAPAYGWVERLYVEGGKLKAMIRDTVAEFADLVKAGRYKKVSISLFLPGSSANPKPGTLYLKHVGFLGAAAPAVPGLKPVQFGGSSRDCLVFSQDAGHGAGTGMEQELRELRRQVSDQKIDALINEGRVLPAFKQEILGFSASLDGSETLSFADGQATTRRDWFLSYLARQPQVVSFGAFKMSAGPDAVNDARAVSVPEGYTVDPRQSELYHQARQIQREKGISFADAVELASGR